jgi:ribulose-phosphate 3-epimerase
MSNNKKCILAASVICANTLELNKDIQQLIDGDIDYLHFDVMDGQFVPRLGLFPEMLTDIKKITNIPVDVHLMTLNPERLIPDFVNAGADIIVVHAESTAHLDHSIRLIKKMGCKAGVALNPATSLSILDYILDDIDLVMIMAINPGIVGHKLIPIAMKKIAELDNKLSNHKHIIIAVDGGVSFETAPEMLKQGANMLVCGTSTIFKKEKPISEKIKELRKLLES